MTHGTSTTARINLFVRSTLLVWLLYALSLLVVVITYARIAPEDLYHVSNDGLRGGLSRGLVHLNFPVAFVAIAITWLSLAVIRSRNQQHTSPWLLGAAVAGTLFSLVAVIPGVVDQGDLDAKPINAIPVLGVAIALVLSVMAMRNPVPSADEPWLWTDRIGLALIAVGTFVALPLIVADLGFFIDDIPLFNRIFIAREIPAGEIHPAVHPGHHHGLDGLLFIVTAVVLARPWRTLPAGPIRTGLSAYLAFMMGYGIANLANDAWYEQLFKRGTTDYEIPSFTRPEITAEWGIVVIGMIVIWFFMFRRHPARRDAA